MSCSNLDIILDFAHPFQMLTMMNYRSGLALFEEKAYRLLSGKTPSEPGVKL
jgi:hypothetical protein